MNKITREQVVEFIKRLREKWLKKISEGDPAYEYQEVKLFDAILAALAGPGVDGGFINRWQEEMELETEMGGTIHPPKWQLEQMLKEAGVKILGKGAANASKD